MSHVLFYKGKRVLHNKNVFKIIAVHDARDQASDVVLRKLVCVKYLHCHVIHNHNRDFQASNCARVSIKPGRATRSKRQLLERSKNQR